MKIRLRGVQVLPLWTILRFPWLCSDQGQEIAFHFYHRLSFWRASESHDTFHSADLALAWFPPISPVSSCPELVSSGQFVHPLVLWGPLYCVYILTLVLAWKQEISLLLGGTWDHLFLSCIGWCRRLIDSSHHLRSCRRVWRSVQSCLEASGPRSSSDIWSSMADLISKSSPPECSMSIFIIDSPLLLPNTRSCL